MTTEMSADYVRLLAQLAIDAAEIGVFDWDLVSGELHWDARLMELFGYDAETFGGTIEAFNAALHPDDVGRVNQALRESIECCREFTSEYRVVLPGGRIRWIGARGRAVADEEGRAVRLLGAAFDTTAVQEGESRIQRILEAMPAAFFSLDSDWRFTYVNSEAERLLGARREDLVGGVVWDLFPAAPGSDFESYYRRAMETREPVSFDAYYPAPLDAWYEVRAWPSPDALSVYFNDVTARRRAEEQLKAVASRNELLAEVTEELTGTLEIEKGVARLARLIVPGLADWCVITLVDELTPDDWRRGLRDVGWWHADPKLRPLVDRYTRLRIPALTDDSLVGRSLASGRPMVVSDNAFEVVSAVLAPGEARDIFQRLHPTTAAVIPLRGRGRTIGLVSAFRDARRPGFTATEVETLQEVAARAGLALHNARLFGQQQELAEGLQRSMLTEPPEPDDLQIVVRYEPAAQAAQVGGDWYDSFMQPDGSTMVIIGDVVGHDTAAAAAMGQVRSLLRGIAVHSGEGPADVLRGVDVVMETLQAETTATAVVARLEQTDDERDRGVTRLRWSNAGHPPPMLLQTDGSVTVLDSAKPDLLLGLDPAVQRVESVVTLERGATLLMYTDGLVERRGRPLHEGLEELSDALCDLAARQPSLERLCDEVIRRMLPAGREDDVAVLGVRLHPQD